ncbi:hypothetical protein BGM26_15250 [Bacillus sp. FJAT-29790]|uniref:hypothetical protein n=1 Tax=Bacillus sp. FJAT-29790 TaxID=1895002 RepID=UPI001C242518|nr:hypothetical protein [Bacillus sp. FJAT-29790]MBU8880307.1 hypothetical protein [Bacillus sp. FJAT-29790]
MSASIIFLVIALTLIAVVLTLIAIRKGDQNYSKAHKKNTTNLTLIYAIAIFLSLLALGIYIWLK